MENEDDCKTVETIVLNINFTSSIMMNIIMKSDVLPMIIIITIIGKTALFEP
jgi:hypothetical protein